MRATNWLTALTGCSSLACVAGLLLVGCARSTPDAAARSPAPSAAAPVESARLSDREWAVLRSPSLGLKLALPEARAWLADSNRAPGAGWELRHEPTGSALSVRRWRASRLPNIEACEAELRQRTPRLATPDESNVVARRVVRVPEGFSTRITLMVEPGDGQRLRGQVTAVGAGIGECFSVLARTECATEAELAERLRLLDVAVGHVRRTHIEDRVRTPKPISP